MNVLMFSPGFPRELRYFTRGLAEVGANVIGLGDTPRSALPEPAGCVSVNECQPYVEVGLRKNSVGCDRERRVEQRSGGCH